MIDEVEKHTKYNEDESDEITLKELIIKIKEWAFFIFSQKIKLLIVGVIGALIGLAYAWYQPTNYTAKITFLVEESKSSGAAGALGGLASIAGQLGVDVGGSGGAGLLSGDNILFYFRSSALCREVLLSKYDALSKKSIADFYADVYKKRKDWENDTKIGKIFFPPLSEKTTYTRLQDSLLQSIVQEILLSQFVITKTDKKASFIEVSTQMQNEELANLYNERIVKLAIDKYIDIKTQRQKSTVDKLQMRVDSIASLLTKKTLSGATLQTSSNTMDINPLYKTGTTVAVETTVRDKTMLATIFASVVQNLELAKFTLSQETPVIQIVDKTRYPLKKTKVRKLYGLIYGGLIAGFLFLFWIIVKRVYKNIME
jgi:hypothetical protein